MERYFPLSDDVCVRSISVCNIMDYAKKGFPREHPCFETKAWTVWTPNRYMAGVFCMYSGQIVPVVGRLGNESSFEIDQAFLRGGNTQSSTYFFIQMQLYSPARDPFEMRHKKGIGSSWPLSPDHISSKVFAVVRPVRVQVSFACSTLWSSWVSSLLDWVVRWSSTRTFE